MPVEFDESIPEPTRPANERKMSGLSQMLIKAGVVKTERGASIVFLITAVLAVAVAVFIFSSSMKPIPAPTPEQVWLP